MLTEQEKLEVQKEALRHVGLCKKLFNVEVSPNVPSPPKLACVYAFEMSNDLIKIGMTQKVGERKKGVNNFLSVKRIHHTEFAPLPFIREIESICHRAFADRRVRGEYFNITFEEAVAELDRHAQKIAEVFRAADKKYLEKIIYFYEDFLPKYEKKVEMSEAELPEVVTVEGVRGYLDDEGTAYLNVEDVARGLGFVQVHKERVTENGRTYVAVRWDRVNKYRAEFDLKPVKAGDFIPENEFYLLAMKANNEAAKTFQLEVANKILPSIRKTGYYSVSNQPQPVLPAAEMEDNIMARMKKQVAEIVTDLAVVYVLLMSNFTIKIGVTGNLNERIKQIKADTKLDVFRYYSTRYMPREDALKLEAKLKQKYAADCVGGEFFDVKFSDVCSQF